jgi:hypothetical protein
MIRTVTGSDGNNPVFDGAARGIIFGALTAILVFADNKLDWLTEEDVSVLTPIIVAIAFFLGGLWDRYVAPKI